jgi:hypothetical protein
MIVFHPEFSPILDEAKPYYGLDTAGFSSDKDIGVAVKSRA